MERPELIPHLTPQEKVKRDFEERLKWLKERTAKVQAGKTSETEPLQPRVPDEKTKASGECNEKELVRDENGEWIYKEYENK